MSLRKQTFNAPASVRGAGLIEVLVAVLVMAIGLLGIAAMQATALRNSQSALERSQAVVQTYSIIDAMRANREAALAGAYVMGMTCDPPANGDLAATDQQAWIQSLEDTLSETSACGQITAAANDVFTVTVRWDDSRGSQGVSDQMVETTTRL